MSDLGGEICVHDRCYRFATTIERWPIEPGRIVRVAFCDQHRSRPHVHDWSLCGYAYDGDPPTSMPIAACSCGDRVRWEAP